MTWNYLVKTTIRVFVLIFTLEALIVIGNQIPILKDIELSLLEFDLTDFYTSSQARLASFETDTNLVLVNAKWLERDSIGLLLTKISSLNSKATVIGITFKELKNKYQDSLLLKGINDLNNPFLLGQLFSVDGECILINGSHSTFLEKANLASDAILFQQASEISRYIAGEYGVNDEPVIRYFRSTIRSRDPFACDTLNHIALEVAKIYDDEAYWQLLLKENNLLLINYTGNIRSNRFKIYDYKEIFNDRIDRSDFVGKIVLVGFLGDDSESFKNVEATQISPLNKNLIRRSNGDMHHTEIIANIISMVLDKRYLKEASLVLTWILNKLVIVLTIILMSYLWLRFNKKNYILRIQSYSTAIILGSFSLLLISQLDYKLDFREAIFYAIFIPEIFIIYVSYLEPKMAGLVERMRLKIKSRLKICIFKLLK